MLDNTEFNTEDFMASFSDLDTKTLEPVDVLETPVKTQEELDAEAKIIADAKEKEDIENVNDKTVDNEQVIEPTIYSGIIDLVKEEAGLFSSLKSEEIKDATQLVEAIKAEITEGIEDKFNSLPPVIHELIKNYEEGVSLRDLIELQSNEVELDSISEEDLEDKDLQKNIVTQYLKSTTKFSDAKIEKEINKLDDLDELKETALDNLGELKELSKVQKEEVIAKAKQDKIDSDLKQKQNLENLKKDVTSTKEIIPGIILHEKDQVTLFKQMTTPVAFDKQGNPISKVQEIRMKDPIAFEKTLNYLVMKGVFEKDYSLFKTVEAAGKTKAITDFEKLAAKTVNNKERGIAAKIAGPLEETMLNALG